MADNTEYENIESLDGLLSRAVGSKEAGEKAKIKKNIKNSTVGGDRVGTVLTSRERTVLAAKATVFWQTYYKIKKKEDPKKDTKGKTVTPAEVAWLKAKEEKEKKAEKWEKRKGIISKIIKTIIGVALLSVIVGKEGRKRIATALKGLLTAITKWLWDNILTVKTFGKIMSKVGDILKGVFLIIFDPKAGLWENIKRGFTAAMVGALVLLPVVALRAITKLALVLAGAITTALKVAAVGGLGLLGLGTAAATGKTALSTAGRTAATGIKYGTAAVGTGFLASRFHSGLAPVPGAGPNFDPTTRSGQLRADMVRRDTAGRRLPVATRAGLGARAGLNIMGPKIPIIGGGVSGALEYMDTGHVGKAVTRGGGTALGSVLGGAVGGAIGLFFPPALPWLAAGGSIIGGLLGDHIGKGAANKWWEDKQEQDKKADIVERSELTLMQQLERMFPGKDTVYNMETGQASKEETAVQQRGDMISIALNSQRILEDINKKENPGAPAPSLIPVPTNNNNNTDSTTPVEYASGQDKFLSSPYANIG